MNSHHSRSSRAHSIERLESRIAPAVLVSATTKTATWTDFDGDLVTLKWTGAAAPTFTGHVPSYHVTGGYTVDRIDLHNAGDAITLTVKRGPLGGDGHIDLGYINATGLALKSFSAPHASVLEFDAGDSTSAIGALSIASYGTLSSAGFSSPGGDGHGNLNGNVGTVKIAGDLDFGQLTIGHNPTSTVGSVIIGGSIHGDVKATTGVNGSLDIFGKAGAIQIGGSVIGGSLASSGALLIHNQATTLSILGDVLGGSQNNAGDVTAGTLTSFRLGGSLIGGSGGASGAIDLQSVKSVTIGGDLQGGSLGNTGVLTLGFPIGPVGTVVIRGSIIGGVALNPGSSASSQILGSLVVYGDVTSISVGRNVVAGSTVDTDNTTNHVQKNGSILVGGTLGSLTIGGSLEGTDANRVFVTARGTTPTKTGNFNGIGKLSIKGSVIYSIIASGQSFGGSFSPTLGVAENPDAGIGSVTIGRDYYHSSIIAGSNNDGGTLGVNASDLQQQGDPTRIAILGPVTIRGAVLDDTLATGFSGFEAEQVAKITIGGNTVFTHSTHGDINFYLDPYHFILVRELPI